MNKEKIITISIGLFVGIVAAVGYFAALKVLPALQKPTDQIVASPPPEVTPGDNQKPVVAAANDIQLTLDQPADQSSTSEANLKVMGQSVPGSTLVIFSNGDEKIASADASGKFFGDIKLEEGENEISITSFFGKTNSSVIHRNVTLEVSL